MKPHQRMRLDYHNGQVGGYFAHSIDIDIGAGEPPLTIIQELHNAERGFVDRQAFFYGLSGGGGQITRYQPHGWPTHRFEPKVQIFGVDYSKKREVFFECDVCGFTLKDGDFATDIEMNPNLRCPCLDDAGEDCTGELKLRRC